MVPEQGPLMWLVEASAWFHFHLSLICPRRQSEAAHFTVATIFFFLFFTFFRTELKNKFQRNLLLKVHKIVPTNSPNIRFKVLYLPHA